MTTIAWRVKELAEQRKWNARHLARAARLDEKTVRNILAGRATRVDLDTIASLSAALGVRPGALWAVRPDPLAGWTATAGAAGTAGREDLARVLSGEAAQYDDDPALERALRSSP